MVGIIAFAGLVGFVLVLAGPGGWSRLGGAFAGSAALAVLLMPVAGLLGFVLAVPVMGAAMGLLPPFDRETAPRKHVSWLVCVLLAMTGLFLWSTVGDTEMIAVTLFLFGPGALAAAGRLIYFLAPGDA
ncbi:hypothetical protein AB0I84_41260 [Streptomyces spectabilis]|uniref:hypothetical protein n=1 Tax=Streptomyces spectabilis TaxID=68270 RepID=UPI0033CDF141